MGETFPKELIKGMTAGLIVQGAERIGFPLRIGSILYARSHLLPWGSFGSALELRHDMAQPEAIDRPYGLRQCKGVRSTANQQGVFDLIGVRGGGGEDVGHGFHNVGIRTASVLGPPGFHQHEVPGTRPDKIDLAVLLITIKEHRRPWLTELLILP